MKYKVGNRTYEAESSKIRFCYERKLWRRLFTLLGLDNCNYRVFIGDKGALYAAKADIEGFRIRAKLNGQQVWKYSTKMPKNMAQHIVDTAPKRGSLGEILAHVTDLTDFTKHFNPDGDRKYG